MKKELVFNFMWSFTQNKICFNVGLSEFESMSKLSFIIVFTLNKDLSDIKIAQ